MLILAEYENFVYTLQAQFKSIKASTLVVKHTSATSAHVFGYIYFDKNVVLRVFEAVDFLTERIEDYSYEVYHHSQKLYWYDAGRTRMIRRLLQHFRITNTSHPISSTTAFQQKTSLSSSQIYLS